MYTVHEVHAQRQLFCHVNTCTVYYIQYAFTSVLVSRCRSVSSKVCIQTCVEHSVDIPWYPVQNLLMSFTASTRSLALGFPFAFTDRTDRTSTCRYHLSLTQNLYHDLFSVRHRQMDVDGTVWGFDKAQETVGSAEARIWSLPLSLLAMLGFFQFLVFLGGRYVSLGDPGWLL